MPGPNDDGCVKRERRSRFVEIFRTTPTNTVCPNFYVLRHADGCSFSPQCSYCYLKSSFWFLKEPHLFTNVDKLVREIKTWLDRDDLESYILNMGNLSDSLVFEDSRPLMPTLVRLFREEAEAKGKRHSLLLVTKGGTRECRGLFELQPCKNVIISFSVNNPQTAGKHERGAAAVEDRFRAAGRLKSMGWRVRIRIDPMILGFRYGQVAEQVKRLGPERVTLGSLRAEASLLRMSRNGLFSALERPEEERGLARYPREERLALYRQAAEVLAGVCPIALCEETPDIWNALGLDADAKSCNCGL